MWCAVKVIKLGPGFLSLPVKQLQGTQLMITNTDLYRVELFMKPYKMAVGFGDPKLSINAIDNKW